MKAMNIIYGSMVGLMLAAWIWGVFDIHNRITDVLGVQAVVLLARVPWKIMMMRERRKLRNRA